ncbi:ESPR-type extended signal peptide-containing protein, partial [Burkholderia cenocepacia]|uniref:ESPR-type extended signal peptide-containing protein n=1 Tax=Burkholderia cenocepacia TaxID=95486 RepID=UPI002AB5F947
MNKMYRIVWSNVTNSWVAVSELAIGNGKSKNRSVKTFFLGLLLSSNAFAELSAGGGSATAESSIAIGANGRFGRGPIASADGSIAIGSSMSTDVERTEATGDNAIAIGAGAQATDNSAVAFGQGSAATYQFSTAIGSAAKASADHATAIGGASAKVGGAVASGTGSTAIGGNENGGASAAAQNSVAIAGQSSVTKTAVGGVAIGAASTTSAAAGVAIGARSLATGDFSLALGGGAHASDKNSVAIGYLSETTPAVGTTSVTLNGVVFNGFAGTAPIGTVSVGNAGDKRQIVNVAAGRVASSSTDAVNGSQLYSVAQHVAAATTVISNVSETVNNITSGTARLVQQDAAT